LIVEGARDYAILTADAAGTITSWSPGAEAIFGWTAAEAVGQSLDMMFVPEDRAADVPAAERAQATVEGAAPDVRWHQCADGRRVFIDGTMRALWDSEGRFNGFLKVGQDVTRRREIDQAYRASEERLRAVIDSLTDYAIVSLDAGGRIVGWNDGARRLLGYDAAEVYGRTIDFFYTPEDVLAKKPSQELARAADTGRSEEEGWRLRKDGSRFWVNEIVRPLLDSDGRVTGFAKISRDLTERKAFEDALHEAHSSLEARVRERTAEVQSLFTRLINVQEEERRRIARDIHDQLGQQMTALRFNIEALRGQPDPPALSQLVDRIQRLAHEVDQSVDTLTWQLRPAALDHLGLPAALQHLVREWSERFGITAEFAVRGIEKLSMSPDAEANLYRIVQEGLHNIAKHAQATQVNVYVSEQDGSPVLLIEDDGRGFDIDAVSAPDGGRGMGLMNMRERAVLVGGHLDIESAPGHGTSIYVRLPAKAIATERP
ncbi:MAG TPA: PAS domain S-box protein, partial [Luteitalea sp.]|nr:PAS domain S-box protein [Luteitalea sp.]